MQSRELEGRRCHVSLFAREPSFLQRSTTLFPCTLFSPYSGSTWTTVTASDDHHDDDAPPLCPSSSSYGRPRAISSPYSSFHSPSRSSFPLKSGLPPLHLRTTLTLWRTPWICRPSRESWTPGSIRSRGSTWRTFGWCSITLGCTTARLPEFTSTAPSWLRCLRWRLTLSCRAWATVVGGRWVGCSDFTTKLH